MKKSSLLYGVLGATLILAAGCATEPVAHREDAMMRLVVTAERPAAVAGFAGQSACAGCHPRQHSFWQATAHARSLDSLKGVGGEGDSSCLRCHTTGYGFRDGHGQGRGEELSSVGCEACHGPSADHAADPRLGTPSGLRGESPDCRINRVCRTCHTRARDPGFTPGQDFDKMKCPA